MWNKKRELFEKLRKRSILKNYEDDFVPACGLDKERLQSLLASVPNHGTTYVKENTGDEEKVEELMQIEVSQNQKDLSPVDEEESDHDLADSVKLTKSDATIDVIRILPIEKKYVPAILVVDDDVVAQNLLKRILAGQGYDVVIADDGLDALIKLGKRDFDLILLDVNMPNLNGFKLLEFMNQKQILMPVIFLTVREEPEDEIKGLTLGAIDYIKKPINKDLLLIRIRKTIDRNKK